MQNSNSKDTIQPSDSIVQNSMLGEVPYGKGVGDFEVIGKVSNVITQLSSLIHDLSLGANTRICELDYMNAVESFEKLKRHFA